MKMVTTQTIKLFQMPYKLFSFPYNKTIYISRMSTLLHPSLIRNIQHLSDMRVDNVPLIPAFPLTEVVKALLNVHAYRSTLGEQHVKQVSWLQGFLVCVVLGSAGSCTVALIRGEPLSVIYNDEFWITYG